MTGIEGRVGSHTNGKENDLSSYWRSYCGSIGTEREAEQAVSRAEPDNLATLCDEVFLELRDYHLDLSRREKVIEQAPEMREYRSKVRNMLKIDKFVD